MNPGLNIMKKLLSSIVLVLFCFFCYGQNNADNYMQSPDLALRDAHSAFSAGEYEKSLTLIKIYKSLSEKNDGDVLLRNAQLCKQYSDNAILFEEQDEYSAVYQCYKNIIALNPHDVKALSYLDSEWSKSAYMEIASVSFANTDKYGNILSDFGNILYDDEVKYLKPKILYNGLSVENKTIELNIKIINPDRTLQSNTNSQTGYTYNVTTTVSPSSNSTLIISGWGNSNGGAYDIGTHRFEIWYNGNKVYTTTFEIRENKHEMYTGYYNNHSYVDLGLGVKWACCNIGAKNMEDYGDLFAWGETAAKKEYTYENYKLKSNGDRHNPMFTRYSFYSHNVDRIKELQMRDDAANYNWGGNWRMPTAHDFYDLINKCTCKWITKEGVNGCLVTGPNGNSIFFPAAGDSSDNPVGVIYGDGDFGSYWSSTILEDSHEFVWELSISQVNVIKISNSYRYFGQSIRPVFD